MPKSAITTTLPSKAPQFIATSTPGFIGDGSALTNLSINQFSFNNSNCPIITDDSGKITTEKYLSASRGGIGIDSSVLSGIAKIDNGNWSAAQINNNDIAANANISDDKIAIISTVGKVLNSATTANNDNIPNAIVCRDTNGDFSTRNITVTKLIQKPDNNAQTSILSAYVSTSNATTTTLLAFDTYTNSTNGSCYLFDCNIIFSEANGNSNGFYKFHFKAKNVAGNITVSSISYQIHEIDDELEPTWINISANMNNILVQVTGKASTEIHWSGTFTVTQVNF